MSQELAIKSTNDIIFSPTSMQQMHQVATLMASSACTVPQHLRGNVGDCFAIAMQAAQWGMNPFAVAQKTHIVSGTLGYEAQLVNAVITSMAPTKGRLKFEWYGNWDKVIGNFKEETSAAGKKYRKLASTLADEKGCGVRVFATMNDETEPRVLELLLTQAGVRNSTLWADDPKQQLAYLAIKRWSRLYCPDVIMGVYSADELETIPTEREINPADNVSTKQSEELSCDEMLFKIRSMKVDDFKTIDPDEFTDDERKSISAAMTARKKEILLEQKSNVVADIVAGKVGPLSHADIADRIDECASSAELTQFLDSITEADQLEHDLLIGEKYDSFR